jgi:hypothetical protein
MTRGKYTAGLYLIHGPPARSLVKWHLMAPQLSSAPQDVLGSHRHVRPAPPKHQPHGGGGTRVETGVPETRRATSLLTPLRNRTVLDIAGRRVLQQELAQHKFSRAGHEQFLHVGPHLFLMGVSPQSRGQPGRTHGSLCCVRCPWLPHVRCHLVSSLLLPSGFSVSKFSSARHFGIVCHGQVWLRFLCGYPGERMCVLHGGVTVPPVCRRARQRCVAANAALRKR